MLFLPTTHIKIVPQSAIDALDIKPRLYPSTRAPLIPFSRDSKITAIHRPILKGV